MTQPTLPPQVAALPWATQAVSILTAVLGAVGLALTTFGVSAGNAASIQTAIQYIVFGLLSVAGLAAHTHLHATNQTNQTNAQVWTVPPPLPQMPQDVPTMNSGATMPTTIGPLSQVWSNAPVPPPVLPPTSG